MRKKSESFLVRESEGVFKKKFFEKNSPKGATAISRFAPGVSGRRGR